MTSPSTKRLLKESTDLHKHPSPYFTAHPTSESNLHDWHFTLAGPPSPSPYASGLYHGRITFPAAYPLRPPSFRFLTPSGRFEVNREICLSISGHHEETWQPAWGVRTALLAIRSEIFSSEAKGQVGGMEGSEALRREYAHLSREWCCRECGGDNLGRMREWWAVCRETGVEVEGLDDGLEESGKLDKTGDDGDEKKEEESTQALATTPEERQTQQPQPPQPLPPRSSSLAAPVSSSPAPAIAAPAQHGLAPRPQAQAHPASTAANDGVWLDRAIIGVVVALVILILRRFVDVEDL
jgi:ubiquitin-conjugating enzyme E2 J1